MNCHDYITADPAVLLGKPVIRGTRLAVEFVLGLVAQGWSEDEITRNYRLTTEQVRACAAYAQERVSQEKAFATGFVRKGHALVFATVSGETPPQDSVQQTLDETREERAALASNVIFGVL
jgi:uncharacterized protein (DUF433 family)